MVRTVDPTRVEQDARTRWADRDVEPAPVRDDDGRLVAVPPSERLSGISRAARIISVSDSLAEAVAALLRADGVEAVVDHVRVDPGHGDHQVMALRGPGGQVVPLQPGGTTVRVYPPSDDIQLTGEPVAAADVAAEPDGWVTAATIAAALREHLA
ncbi:hypothetical protein [Umezawaea tangerina]|uniref:Uncharacterized protein n=1 Tax=Umezawaea tangerina TaxID=84725 RepID=A0A2T0SPI6_9PSEU|nr:hypothetical protein [Umezawaea tangerina]PRY35320.1 hypothetical protein CLV43_114238 [Umezawaea tangerina]